MKTFEKDYYRAEEVTYQIPHNVSNILAHYLLAQNDYELKRLKEQYTSYSETDEHAAIISAIDAILEQRKSS